jgi:hypothetical protein
VSIVGIHEEPAVRAEPQASAPRAGDADATSLGVAGVVEARAEGLLDLDQDQM